MKSAGEQGMGRFVGLVFAAIAGVFYAWLITAPLGIEHLRNDGAQYAVSAAHIMAGDGITTSLQTYPAQQATPPPVTQRVWPPVYPLVLAAVATLSGQAPEAITSMVLTWCVFMVGALIYIVLRDGGVSRCAAGVAAFLWWSLPLPIYTAGHGQSEAAFTLLVVVAFATLYWRGREPIQLSAGRAVIVGVLFALAFLTRYQGIAFVAGLSVVVVVWMFVHRRWHPLALGAALAAVIVAVQLAINRATTGSIRAGSHAQGDFSLRDLAWEVQFSLRDALGLSADWPTPLPALIGIGVVGVLGLVVMLKAAVQARTTAGFDAQLVIARLTTLPFLALALGLALLGLHLVLTATGGHTYPFEARYLIPALPLLLIASAWLLEKLWHAGVGKVGRALIVFVVLTWWATMLSSWRDRGLPESPVGRPFSERLQDVLEQPLAGVTLAEWLRKRTSESRGLLAADGQVLGLLLKRPVAALTDPYYSREVWTQEAAQALACRVGARWLIVFPWALQEQARHRRPEDVIARLAAGQTPPGWPVVLDRPDVRILAVCEKEQGAQ